jgi:quercetin dioxygenase-like cupin family protein
MQIIRAADGETSDRSEAPIFEGQVWGRTLVAGSDDVSAAIVSFAAGARTRMHRHTSDQMLYVVSGIGKVGDADGDHVIASGDTALIPANTSHWHGAGDTGSPMSHLTLMRAGSETTVDGE